MTTALWYGAQRDFTLLCTSTNHIEMLHDVTQRSVVNLMERYVGPDWERRYDELAAARGQQRQIVEDEPHGAMLDDKSQRWNAWCGVR
jgi:hypothetical protein